MLWVWDLSATLGWAAGGGPGGSWLGRSPPSAWEVRMKLLERVCIGPRHIIYQ